MGFSVVSVHDMGLFRETGKSICCYPVRGGESNLPNSEESTSLVFAG